MSHHATIVPTDNSELDSGEIWPLAIVLPHRQSKDWDASDANVRVYRQRTDSKHSPASTSTDSQQVAFKNVFLSSLLLLLLLLLLLCCCCWWWW